MPNYGRLKCKVSGGSKRVVVEVDKKKYLADYDIKFAEALEKGFEKQAERDRWQKAMRRVINL